MTTELTLAQKVRELQVGRHFIVKTNKDRQAACRVAKSLRDAGVIEFEVVTKRIDGTKNFKVAAI